MRKEISKKDQYLNDLFYYENKTLDSIRAELIKDDKWGVNIGYHEVSLLNYIIKMESVKNILEIGTLYGFSSYAMASSLPLGGELITLEKNKDHYLKANDLLSTSDIASKIKLHNTDALSFLKDCEQKFDLIFIDANKSGYMDYLELGLLKLNTGGLIVGDNSFLFGHVYGDATMKSNDKSISAMTEFNSKYVHNKDFLVTIFPTTEGMTLIKKLN